MEERLNKIADFLKYKGYEDDCEYIRAIASSLNTKIWVPTEEQLDALLDVLHPDEPNFYELKGLYKDLKNYKNKMQ